MTFPSIPDTLRQLADFAEIRGASIEATHWDRIAADLDERSPEEMARVMRLARRNQLSEILSVHPSLQARLHEILNDGPAAAVDAALALLPWMLRRLVESAIIPSVGAAALAREGIATLTDLSLALEDGRIIGKLPVHADRLRLAETILLQERPRTTLGRAIEVLDNLIVAIAAACPSIEGLTPAGDVRRAEPVVETLAIVGSAADPVTVLDAIGEFSTLHVLHRTRRRALVTYQQLEIDIRIATPDAFGTTLYTATGSSAHLMAMRGRRKTQRLCARETDVYAHAGLPWIPPELRQGADEIEAANARCLPLLVAREDIRGDLHLHTTYSDGRDSLEEMVQMAAMLGYEYIAITDHSERANASRTMNRDALMRQRDEIEALRDRFPRLTILHGAEVDIMPDGSLDFPDDLLATLDIVLASLHDGHGHDRARLTSRYLAAIEHPLVNIITHPANRLVGRDPGHDLDFPAIYAAAAASRTVLEIDGAPSHLDLDGDHARDAVTAGAIVSIDSDCHKARLMDRQMRLGVGTARRGWVELQHVLNTRPIDEVRAILRAKKGRQRERSGS